MSGEGSGLHLLWRLPPGVADAAAHEAMARRRRIGVYTLESGGAVSIAPSLLDRRALILGFGAVVPRQIEQGVDLLSEIIDDTIDDPSTDVTEFLVRVPQAPVSVPRERRRPAAYLDSRFRRRPALSNRPHDRATSPGAGNGAAKAMARVVSIYRYPVKGLSAEALPRVALEADPPLPFDRDFALARPTAPIDRDDPQWAKKGLFARSSRPRAVAGSSAGDAITFTTRRRAPPTPQLRKCRSRLFQRIGVARTAAPRRRSSGPTARPEDRPEGFRAAALARGRAISSRAPKPGARRAFY